MPSEILLPGEKKVFELEVRKRVYNVVRKFAGCHFREIERKSKLTTGSVRYHLSYLLKKGLISEVKEGSNVRYFPRGFKSENKTLLGLLRQKSVRGILLFILTHDNCNHKQIVCFIGLSPSTVSWHLKKLEEANIISSIKRGRKTFYKILINRDEIINLLVTYKESFLDSLVDSIVDMWVFD